MYIGGIMNEISKTPDKQMIANILLLLEILLARRAFMCAITAWAREGEIPAWTQVAWLFKQENAYPIIGISQ